MYLYLHLFYFQLKFVIHYDTKLSSPKKENRNDSKIPPPEIKNYKFDINLNPIILNMKKFVNADKNMNISNFVNKSYPLLPGDPNSESLHKSLSKLDSMYKDGLLTEYGLRIKKEELLNSMNNLNTSVIKVKRQLLHLNSKNYIEDKNYLDLNKENGERFVMDKKIDEPLELIERTNSNEDLVENSINVGRKLLDVYAESLLYVNRIYHKEYGFESRKVPAHMPLYIDKNILEEVHQK